MKKLTSLLIGCSLALAGAALAQQPVEQPSKEKRAPEKAHATHAQPGANAAKPQERPTKQTGAIKQPGATNERSATNQPGADTGQKTHAVREPRNAPEANARSKKSTGEMANEASKSAMPTRSGNGITPPREREPGQGVKQPAPQAGTAPANPANNQQNAQANAGAKVKKPAPQQVQQAKSQRANFKAQPKPQQVPSVTLNQNHRIEGSDR